MAHGNHETIASHFALTQPVGFHHSPFDSVRDFVGFGIFRDCLSSTHPPVVLMLVDDIGYGAVPSGAALFSTRFDGCLPHELLKFDAILSGGNLLRFTKALSKIARIIKTGSQGDVRQC